jgi:superfamily II DNA/RNA helicase
MQQPSFSAHFRHQCAKDVTDAIETSLDKNECCDIDVITVHGQLEKEEKFFNLTAFCSDDVVDGFDRQPSRVYTSTASGDHGINHSDLRAEVMCEWPENISVFVQRRGRLVRNGGDGECHLVASLDNFVYLFVRSALRQYNSPEEDRAPTPSTGTNSIFSPQTRPQATTSNLDLLTASKMKKVAMSKMNDLLDMGRLISLNHMYGKYLPVTDKSDFCHTKCPNCRHSEWNSLVR